MSVFRSECLCTGDDCANESQGSFTQPTPQWRPRSLTILKIIYNLGDCERSSTILIHLAGPTEATRQVQLTVPHTVKRRPSPSHKGGRVWSADLR